MYYYVTQKFLFVFMIISTRVICVGHCHYHRNYLTFSFDTHVQTSKSASSPVMNFISKLCYDKHRILVTTWITNRLAFASKSTRMWVVVMCWPLVRTPLVGNAVECWALDLAKFVSLWTRLKQKKYQLQFNYHKLRTNKYYKTLQKSEQNIVICLINKVCDSMPRLLVQSQNAAVALKPGKTSKTLNLLYCCIEHIISLPNLPVQLLSADFSVLKISDR